MQLEYMFIHIWNIIHSELTILSTSVLLTSSNSYSAYRVSQNRVTAPCSSTWRAPRQNMSIFNTIHTASYLFIWHLQPLQQSNLAESNGAVFSGTSSSVHLSTRRTLWRLMTLKSTQHLKQFHTSIDITVSNWRTQAQADVLQVSWMPMWKQLQPRKFSMKCTVFNVRRPVELRCSLNPWTTPHTVLLWCVVWYNQQLWIISPVSPSIKRWVKRVWRFNSCLNNSWKEKTNALAVTQWIHPEASHTDHNQLLFELDLSEHKKLNFTRTQLHLLKKWGKNYKYIKGWNKWPSFQWPRGKNGLTGNGWNVESIFVFGNLGFLQAIELLHCLVQDLAHL